jgi:hypothetical protein
MHQKPPKLYNKELNKNLITNYLNEKLIINNEPFVMAILRTKGGCYEGSSVSYVARQHVKQGKSVLIVRQYACLQYDNQPEIKAMTPEHSKVCRELSGDAYFEEYCAIGDRYEKYGVPIEFGNICSTKECFAQTQVNWLNIDHLKKLDESIKASNFDLVILTMGTSCAIVSEELEAALLVSGCIVFPVDIAVTESVQNRDFLLSAFNGPSTQFFSMEWDGEQCFSACEDSSSLFFSEEWGRAIKKVPCEIIQHPSELD